MLAPRQHAEAFADLCGIVEVALLTLDVADGQTALEAARRRMPPFAPPALERDHRRLRRLVEVTLAPSTEYLGRKVPVALVEVHEALVAEALAA